MQNIQAPNTVSFCLPEKQYYQLSNIQKPGQTLFTILTGALCDRNGKEIKIFHSLPTKKITIEEDYSIEMNML